MTIDFSSVRDLVSEGINAGLDALANLIMPDIDFQFDEDDA